MQKTPSLIPNPVPEPILTTMLLTPPLVGENVSPESDKNNLAASAHNESGVTLLLLIMK